MTHLRLNGYYIARRAPVIKKASRTKSAGGRPALANPFRWSKSRAAVFSKCRRKYYLRYYHHWGGWEEDADPSVRLAYVLGKMISLPALVGISVHDTLGSHFSALRNGQERPLIPERPVETMRLRWKEARDGLWKADPKRYPPIFELYYDRVPPTEELKSWAEKARRTMANLTGMEIYKRLCARPRENLLWAAVPGMGFSERDYFSVGSFEAIALPDLIFREGEETTIVDWKTGQEDEGDRLQMGAAGLWAAQRFGTPSAGLKAVVVYLSEGREEEFEIGSELIARVERTVRGEMKAMAAYLEDRANNIPCGREEFPMIENRRFCGWCEFQEICLKEENDDQE